MLCLKASRSNLSLNPSLSRARPQLETQPANCGSRSAAVYIQPIVVFGSHFSSQPLSIFIMTAFFLAFFLLKIGDFHSFRHLPYNLHAVPGAVRKCVVKIGSPSTSASSRTRHCQLSSSALQNSPSFRPWDLSLSGFLQRLWILCHSRRLHKSKHHHRFDQKRLLPTIPRCSLLAGRQQQLCPLRSTNWCGDGFVGNGIKFLVGNGVGPHRLLRQLLPNPLRRPSCHEAVCKESFWPWGWW